MEARRRKRGRWRSFGAGRETGADEGTVEGEPRGQRERLWQSWRSGARVESGGLAGVESGLGERWVKRSGEDYKGQIRTETGERRCK